MYTADRRSSAMHGKEFLLDSLYAGVDEENFYARVDFVGGMPPAGDVEMKLHCASRDASGAVLKTAQVTVAIVAGKISGWRVTAVEGDEEKLLGPEHPDLAASLTNLGAVYLAQARYSEAESALLRSLAIQSKMLGATHPYTAGTMMQYAGLLRATNRKSEAARVETRAR